MTDKCIWTRVSEFSFRKACGGRVILFAGKPSDHKCVCGKQAVDYQDAAKELKE